MKDNQCPLCGANNICAVVEGKTTCWCFTQPAIAQVGSGDACLCPQCYEQMKQEKPKKSGVH